MNLTNQTETAPEVDLTDNELIVQTLRQVMQDSASPAAAKAQAARTLAEMTGALGRHSEKPRDLSKPVGEMTRDELLTEIASSTSPD